MGEARESHFSSSKKEEKAIREAMCDDRVGAVAKKNPMLTTWLQYHQGFGGKNITPKHGEGKRSFKRQIQERCILSSLK